MGVPRFHITPNVPVPTPGQKLYLDVYSSEELLVVPEVRVSGNRFARYFETLSPRSWRYEFVVSFFDNRQIDISGVSSSTGESGQTVVGNVYDIKFAGVPEHPFGEYPFGNTYFSTAALFPDDPLEDFELLNDPFQFVVRRAQEGAQVVASWLNDLDIPMKLLRKELDWPLSDTDPDAVELLASSVETTYSDIDVLDGTPYYYVLFAQTSVGNFSEVGRGCVLAIDNQPYVDWTEEPAVLSRSVDEPLTPTAGDRYIVPVGSVGANWAGHDNEIATWDGLVWTFEVPEQHTFVDVVDTRAGAVFRFGSWNPAINKRRVDFYAELEDFDRQQDLQSAFAIQRYAQEATLENEQFNFDLDQTRPRPTQNRFLKNFNLVYNEWKGLIDYMCEVYNISTVKLDLLLHAAALAGWDDYPDLENPTRRFLIQNIPYCYPTAGSDDAVSLGIETWLGTGVNVIKQNIRDNLFIANESLTPVIDPVPDPNWQTPDDEIDLVLSLNWSSLAHPRALAIWLDQPFDPLTFVPQDPVLSATVTTEPPSPADEDAYIVPVGATGASWAGQDHKIAIWDADLVAWVFITPADRWSVFVEDTGKTLVWRVTSWDEAIPVESLSRLEWWLRAYKIPGSVYFQFREIPIDGSPPPPEDVELIEDFEDWP